MRVMSSVKGNDERTGTWKEGRLFGEADDIIENQNY